MSDLEPFAAGDAKAAKVFSSSTGRRRRSSRHFFAAAGTNPGGEIFYSRN